MISKVYTALTWGALIGCLTWGGHVLAQTKAPVAKPPVAKAPADKAPVKAPIPAPWQTSYEKFLEARGQKKHAEAVQWVEQACQQAADQFGAAPGKDEAEVLAQLHYALANFQFRQGDNAAAEKAYTAALKHARESVGESATMTGHIHTGLTLICTDAGRLAAAEQHGLTALRIFERQSGPEHVDICGPLENLANLYRGQGKLNQAQPLLERSLEILRRTYGEDHLRVGRTLINLGNLARQQTRWTDAEKLLRRSLAILERTPDEGGYVTVLNSLASNALEQGRFDAAIPLAERALAAAKAQTGARSLAVARVTNTLGIIYRHLGRPTEAEKWLLETYEFHRGQGENTLGLASALSNLAGLYGDLGRFDAAREHALKCLEIFEGLLGPEHPELLAPLVQLANVHSAADQTQEAIKVHRRQLALAEKVYGKEHEQVQFAEYCLGSELRLAKELEEADQRLTRALALAERLFAAGHPRIANTLGNLANVRLDQGRIDEASALERRSIEIHRQCQGSDSLNVKESLYNLALHQAAQDQWLGAARIADEANRIVRRLMAQMLPALAEREQLQFLERTYQKDFQKGLSLAHHGRHEPEIVKLSAEWVLNGKGIAQQVLAEGALLVRDAQDEPTRRALAELVDVRKQLATIALQGASEAEAGQAAALSEREQALAKQLGRAQTGDPWVSLDRVRQQLPTDSVLIELAQVVNLDWKQQKYLPGKRYLAWVIPPAGRGELALVDLGDAEPLEQAIAGCRKALLEARTQILDDGEAEAEQRIRAELAAVSKLLLAPLEKQLAPFRRWIICPDGNAWLVPWSALPQSNGKYVVEDHVVSFVVSGRDVLPDATHAAAVASGNAPLMVADPDYDLAGVKKTSSNAGGKRSAAERGPARAFAAAWPRLPGTAAECRAAATPLGAFAGRKPQVLIAGEATEEAVKAAFQPRVLVLATHGFFLDSTAELGEKGATKPASQLENPLLRCGLVLAGANQNQARRQAGVEDGVLTGLEIVGLDLRGTELAVLSACETALGDVRGGEGVAGLRQAFQLAGARSVVASLWKVPDQETAQLMAGFWERLAKGADKAEALRDAQVALLEGRRKQGQAAHPLFWAAFTLTGGWSAMTAGPERKRPEAAPPSTAVVVGERVQIMDGAKALAQAARGQRLSVLEQKGAWVRVSVPGSEGRSGWVPAKDVRLEP